MKHQTSSLQLCGQLTVLALTPSTTRFGEAAGACVPQPDSWRRPAEVAPDRRVGTFPPGSRRWSGQAVATTSSSLRSSTRWRFWTQTLGVLTSCHSHGRTLQNQSRLCLQWTLMLLSDLTKLAVAVADVDRFCWNLVTSLQFNVSVLSLKSDVVCQSYGNVYRGAVFSWTRCIAILEQYNIYTPCPGQKEATVF